MFKRNAIMIYVWLNTFGTLLVNLNQNI